ncbi:RNA polymerase sigma factor [Erythrobacter sp.]|jgi:RNA polymerase sigma-70 factor (ECF subfamily)|uniref:RNA polymerase sigma factor n=1 Tax=Erythrobacter sp. TaxID=1042 RepID=UPI002EB41CEE|nr:sigma-70 family RNA polymerase sigma factor [Erythrobacter sp.]
MTTKSASIPAISPSSGALFDEWLVVEAQAGDRAAAERLYRRWNPRLARAARRYGAGEDAALDLAQECWLAIFKGLPRLRDPARFRSYAFAVLHRRGADHLRRVTKDRAALTTQPSEQLTRPDAPPGETLAIRQAFASLPPDQRLAAHLFFIEGLTLREIAEVQSIPEGTAKSRLFHARRKLKDALTPEFEGENL